VPGFVFLGIFRREFFPDTARNVFLSFLRLLKARKPTSNVTMSSPLVRVQKIRCFQFA